MRAVSECEARPVGFGLAPWRSGRGAESRQSAIRAHPAPAAFAPAAETTTWDVRARLADPSGPARPLPPESTSRWFEFQPPKGARRRAACAASDRWREAG